SGAEVSSALSGGRHDGHCIRRNGGLAKLLKAGEEKCLVAAAGKLWDCDWSAEGESVINLAKRISHQFAGLPGIGGALIRKRQTGVEDFVDEIIEGASVQLIGA